MSSMDYSSDRPTFHRLRSDQERERRRMRDRERRRSMTSVQRERHLARRRRNYQLRLQKMKYQDSVVQSGTMNAEINGLNHRQAGVYDTKSAIQISCVAPVGSGQVLLKVHGEHSSRPKGKEPLAYYDLTKLRRRLGLIHVKHFARLLRRPLGELAVNNIPILADLTMNRNQVSCCKLVHGVRLNHVKELARGRKNILKDTSEQLPMSEAEGNLEEWNLLPVEGHPPTPTDESRTEVTVSATKVLVSRTVPPGDTYCCLTF